MARKLTTAKTFEKVEYAGFLERPMTGEELEACDGWHAQPNEIFELIEALTEDTYQLSLSYAVEKGEATATMMDRKKGRASAGYMLSARGENCADALKLLLFKHFTILDRDWSQLVGVRGNARRG